MTTEFAQIGYLPKNIRRVRFAAMAEEKEILSISNCISEPACEIPFHDTSLTDCYLFPSDEIGDQFPHATLLSFALMRTVFRDGRAAAFAPIRFRGASTPTGSTAVRGYEAVNAQQASFGYGPFECSPLSCNSVAEVEPTNQYCLCDELESAVRLAREFSKGGYEPGDYFVVQVSEVINS